MYGVAQSKFEFLHKLLVYGVACLLHGVTTLDSVFIDGHIFTSLELHIYSKTSLKQLLSGFNLGSCLSEAAA